jgi:chromosome segregation ATPase
MSVVPLRPDAIEVLPGTCAAELPRPTPRVQEAIGKLETRLMSLEEGVSTLERRLHWVRMEKPLTAAEKHTEEPEPTQLLSMIVAAARRLEALGDRLADLSADLDV